jgi:hypothetical protein
LQLEEIIRKIQITAITLDKNIIVATGTSGTDVSLDGGKNFKNISAQSFNVVQKSRKDNVIFLVGDKGNVYKLSISK